MATRDLFDPAPRRPRRPRHSRRPTAAAATPDVPPAPPAPPAPAAPSHPASAAPEVLVPAPPSARPAWRRSRASTRRGGWRFWAAVVLVAGLVGGGVVGVRRAALGPAVVDRGPAAPGGDGRGVVTASAGGEVVPGQVVDLGAVQRFTFWAGQGGAAAVARDGQDAGAAAAEGIRLLADALAALGGDGARVDAMRARADRLGEGGAGKTAAEARTALLEAARLLGTLRGDGAPDLVALAGGIVPAHPLAAQAGAVRAFFRQAAELLPTR